MSDEQLIRLYNRTVDRRDQAETERQALLEELAKRTRVRSIKGVTLVTVSKCTVREHTRRGFKYVRV